MDAVHRDALRHHSREVEGHGLRIQAKDVDPAGGPDDREGLRQGLLAPRELQDFIDALAGGQVHHLVHEALVRFQDDVGPTVFANFIRYSFRWPMARTRPAPIARHTATAMRPIGPRPKIATVFPGTFAFVVVYTAFPSGSCIVASSGGRSGSFTMTFEAGTFRYSAKAPSRSIPMIDTDLQTCAFPVRHM